MTFRLIGVTTAILSMAWLSAQNWPSFRGDHAKGTSLDASPVSNWNLESGRNIRWKTRIPGLAHSSPIVWKGVIYLTTSIPESESAELKTGDVDAAGIDSAPDLHTHTWKLLALDRETGRLLWSRTAHQGVPSVKRHVKASHSSQTPATDGKRIVALFGSEGLYCFDMNGTLLWKTPLGILDVGLWGEPEYQWGPASSPVIHGELVFVQNDRQKDSELLAFNLEDGSRMWQVRRDEKPAWSTPLIYRGDREELITNSGNYLRAYDPTSGRELWRLTNHDREVVTPSPVTGEGLIIITGGYPPGRNPIYAIRPGGQGELPATPDDSGGPGVVWETERGSPYTSTPIIHEGILYVCTDNGILSAYDMKTGERFYQARLAGGAGFSASPVASGERLYFASEDGEVYVVRAGKEYELLASNDLGEPLMATPAISNDLLIVRGREHLFGIGAVGEASGAP